MRLRSIKSWIFVLSAFLIVTVLCSTLQKVMVDPDSVSDAQSLDPQTAVAPVSSCVVSLWAVKQQGVETDLKIIGSGLVVDSQGFVITSASLPPDIQSLYIIDYKDTKFEAKLVVYDKKSKLALLKADALVPTDIMPFECVGLADSVQVKAGDEILVLGSRRTPSGWELATKTGKVTDPYQSLIIKKVRHRGLLQTDVEMTSENAGGPLVNSRGIVVGFALPFVQPDEGTSPFSYAVTVDKAHDFLSRLPLPHWTAGASEPVCNWLGAEMLGVNPVMATGLSTQDSRGQIVNHIQNNSPAERAGLKRGDIVMEIGQNRITDSSSFNKTALELCQTNKTKLEVLRDGNIKTLTLNWNEAVYTPSGGGSMAEVVLVVLIFSVMYYFVYRNVFDRVVLFVLGAIVVAIAGHHLGFYDQNQMASALFSKLDVLLFIMGMQLVTGVLDEAGALKYLAKKITLITKGDSWRVMWLFCLLTYVFSMFVNNLTTIMLMAPMVLSLSKYMDCNPKPFLISMIIASNLGGASTMVGDFPNILIGTETGLPFYQFTSYMLPICLLELLVLLVYLRIAKPSLFKIKAPLRPLTAEGYPSFEPPDNDFPELADSSDSNDYLLYKIRQSLPGAIENRKALRRGLIILAIVIAGFLLSDAMKWSPAIIALVGGVIALAFGGCEPIKLLQKVSIRDILFFSGLFVLIGAADASGAIGYLSGTLVSFSFGNTLVLCLLVMWAGAIVTCFLNAGPAAALFLPMVLSFKSAAPHSLYWWSLSLGVCAGSSGTLVGATAGSVTATMVDKLIKKTR